MNEHSDPANAPPPSVDRFSALWRRVNDHKIVQWTVAYVALAYGIQHGVTLTTEAFEWPHAVERVTMLLLILGLPVMTTLAWYHGARASRRISGPELSIISILLVMGTFLFYVFARPAENIATAPSPTTQQANIASGPGATVGLSIAVLPFANMSGDTSQEFFSDGMTEEITSALAKVTGLTVLGRTSAFQFKGQNRDLREIGHALQATHLIEGSVRKAGDRVRITAQLIRTDNGAHLWTESYDGELKDIFATQENIAQAIVGALQVPLGLKPGENLVNNRGIDPDSYQQYLRAKALYGARGYNQLVEASSLLQQVVARNPDYAPAWALLGLTDTRIPVFHPGYLSGQLDLAKPVISTYLPSGEAAANKAIQLDPKLADSYVVLGFVQMAHGHYLGAVDYASKALALDPNNADALHSYSSQLANLGYLKQALELRQRLRMLEPFVPVFTEVTAVMMFANGQNDAAIALLDTVRSLRASYLAPILAAEGRYREAATVLDEILPGAYLPGTRERAQALLRLAPAHAPPSMLGPLGALDWAVYPYVGALDRVMDYPEAAHKAGLEMVISLIYWARPFDSVRKTERFKNFVRDAGMLEYWKAKGWPDFCHPVGADDFECN